MTKLVDRILMMLSDREYTIEEIAVSLDIDGELASRIASFLIKFEFVKKENSKLKITERGLRFLRI